MRFQPERIFGMNIIIVGSGKVGFTLAEQLVKEEHDVTIVDTDEEALRRAGATFEDEAPPERREALTKADLFALGLTGGEGSAERRRLLLKRLDLPEHLTANGMLEALNLLFDREALEALLAET